MLPGIAWTLPATTDSPARVESARCSSHPQTSSPSIHLGYSVNIAHSPPGWLKLSWLDIWYVVIYTLCELQTEAVVLSVGYWSTPKPILRNSSSITYLPPPTCHWPTLDAHNIGVCSPPALHVVLILPLPNTQEETMRALSTFKFHSLTSSCFTQTMHVFALTELCHPPYRWPTCVAVVYPSESPDDQKLPYSNFAFQSIDPQPSSYSVDHRRL